MRGKPVLFIPASGLSPLPRARYEGCSPTPKTLARSRSSCVPGDLLGVARLLREQHNRLLSCDAASWAQFDWGSRNFEA